MTFVSSKKLFAFSRYSNSRFNGPDETAIIMTQKPPCIKSSKMSRCWIAVKGIFLIMYATLRETGD